jgi:UDPglucose--hexose-1-phosphate uridylyltransferase
LLEDAHTGIRTYVVGSRQQRPNLPSAGCPFCPGGLEAPELYDVRWFPNRWPSMPGERCEVVLYTPDHDATFWSLGQSGARKVIDLWAERTAALASRPEIDYVLVFENRGAEVGATIAHPHGQIYAFDFVPELPLRELEHGGHFDEPGERLVATSTGWRAWVPEAPIFPYASLRPGRARPRPAIARPGRPGRSRSAARRSARGPRSPLRCADAVHAVDPSAPFDGEEWTQARLHIEIVTPWRAPGVPRFVAAGELGSGVYFNPIAPEAAAQSP